MATDYANGITYEEQQRARFESLWRDARSYIYHTAYSITGNPEEAEDLVQETAMRAYAGFNQFRSEAKFTTWISRILYNCRITQCRKNKKAPEIRSYEEVFGVCGDANYSDGDPSTNPEQSVVARVPEESLQRALAGVSDKCRTPLLLCDVGEFSYEELADMLGMPLGTVKSRLFRGRRMLRKQLLQEPEELEYYLSGTELRSYVQPAEEEAVLV